MTPLRLKRLQLLVSRQEGYTCYWSRSRNQLWRKGETSGNTQKLIEIRIDCDGDCLLCLADRAGPTCHTGRLNCFYLGVRNDSVCIPVYFEDSIFNSIYLRTGTLRATLSSPSPHKKLTIHQPPACN